MTALRLGGDARRPRSAPEPRLDPEGSTSVLNVPIINDTADLEALRGFAQAPWGWRGGGRNAPCYLLGREVCPAMESAPAPAEGPERSGKQGRGPSRNDP